MRIKCSPAAPLLEEQINQTPSMWLEGRGIGPINPHVPYSAVTASNWSLVTASQQHHSSFDTAGERDGGWAISETKIVCSQNRCKMGRSNPRFSHPLPCSSPSKQADHALEKSAGGSFSQANAAGWCIVPMMIWVQLHRKIKFVVIFHFTSNASYQTSQLTLTTFSYYWLKRGGWKKWPRGKDLCIFDQLSSFPLTQ